MLTALLVPGPAGAPGAVTTPGPAGTPAAVPARATPGICTSSVQPALAARLINRALAKGDAEGADPGAGTAPEAFRHLLYMQRRFVR